MARTLAGPIGHRADGFDLLRTAAAMAVIISHAFPLATGMSDAEPFNRSGWTPGACAVIVFFALSGFLIAGSFERHPDFIHFASSRARRILPAHLIALLVVTAGFGAAATTLDLSGYWAHPATWQFLARNALLDTSAKMLPGVFADNPYTGTVNGSLWSLPKEVLCYALLYSAGRAGLLRPQCCAWFVLSALAALVLVRINGADLTLPHVMPSFLAGVAFYVYRRKVPASLALFTALLGLAWLGHDLPLHSELVRVVIAYGALTVATRSTRLGKWIAAKGDHSYGLYLYGWPVTQMVVWMAPGIGAVALLALVVPITALFAMASWRWIEQPMLRASKVEPDQTSRLSKSHRDSHASLVRMPNA